MPLDILISWKKGAKDMHYVPMSLMYGSKPAEDTAIARKVYDAWRWTHPTYTIQADGRLTDIAVVEIDPSLRMADTERRNNRFAW